MPRRNRNAGTPPLDPDQLAADLAQLAADLRSTAPAGRGTSTVVTRYLATYTARLLTVTDGKQQPLPQLTLGSR
jgi:hypothetical protein